MLQNKWSLHCVHGEQHGLDQVEVSAKTNGNLLNLTFAVSLAQESHVNSKFSNQQSCPGLWDWDVVEVFLTLDQPCSPPRSERYLEFQLSQLGQHFELEVLEPRKKTNPQFKSGLLKSVSSNGRQWSGHLTLDMTRLGWNWDGNWSLLRGGFFAILGQPQSKKYYAAHLPKQSVPDFHLPQHFKSFFELN